MASWQHTAKANRKQYAKLLDRLNHTRHPETLLPPLHHDAFSKIDCLECAGCCKTISPRFKKSDISRIAKHLRLKEAEMINTYLRIDEDGDHVVKKSPCPFLGDGNRCSIYEARPRDCRGYPYTDRAEFFQHYNSTLLNSAICPAVAHVLEKLNAIK
ncbi:MAG: YkgJ family cysteine cluster protein [Chitinophagales bacterium]